MHHSPTLGALAWSGEVFTTVTVLDDTELQIVINRLRSEDGGTILLTPGATYVLDATVNIPSGAPLRIDGRGAILQAGTALDAELLTLNGNDIDFIDCIFDGEESTQTAGDGLGMISTSAITRDVNIRNCEFTDSWGNGLLIKNNSVRWRITDCHFRSMGESGIKVEDPANATTGIYITGCTFGQFISERESAHAGIDFAGIVNISHCNFVGLDHATFAQYGVWAHEKESASPNDESGKESSIIGCHPRPKIDKSRRCDIRHS